MQRGHGRGSTDGSRRLRAAPAASALGARGRGLVEEGLGGKGLLRSAISISLKGRRPLGARGRNLHLNRQLPRKSRRPLPERCAPGR